MAVGQVGISSTFFFFFSFSFLPLSHSLLFPRHLNLDVALAPYFLILCGGSNLIFLFAVPSRVVAAFKKERRDVCVRREKVSGSFSLLVDIARVRPKEKEEEEDSWRAASYSLVYMEEE